jgi:hypothetical protein
MKEAPGLGGLLEADSVQSSYGWQRGHECLLGLRLLPLEPVNR